MELVTHCSGTVHSNKATFKNTNDIYKNGTGERRSPYQQHDVQEWSRLDARTGFMEHARVQQHRWSNNSQNFMQQYGKVIDSRDRSAPDGNIKERHQKQLEVFQTQTSSSSLQVIRTSTISSSSSRWSTSSCSTPNKELDKPIHNLNSDFENLQLSINPLDLSSQKSKASVGRSGSISGRRPPTRPRSLLKPEESTENLIKCNSSENLTESKHADNFLEEWKRTAKIRRSLQLSKTKVDIPIETGNVNKLIQEVEKGRRLNSAIRNTSVDLEALDQILKSISPMISSKYIEKPEMHTGGYTKEKPKSNPSFITAESLQEVRGKLRKLDIEPDDGIEDMSRVKSYVYGMENIRKTGSLESRNYNRSEDWYNRRKTYGFEKMHSADAKLQARKDASTDSGICRSTEMNPYSSKAAQDELNKVWNKIAKKDMEVTTIRIPFESENKTSKINIVPELKRHSIAVDESKYIKETDPVQRRTSLAVADDKCGSVYLGNGEFEDMGQRRTKKVEFCKTEVHFAAESGRVNIVETDEKPPPTQNYRRRRRVHTPVEEIPSNLPLTHFGDEKYPYVTNTSIKVSTESEDLSESETPRGILKNKPVKPRPYHLGDNNEIPSSNPPWGVRLRSIIDEPKSASVADRIKQVETNHYLTKVNFDEIGNSVVLSNDSTRFEENTKATSILNKALVVRFGQPQEKPSSPTLPTQKSPIVFNKIPRATLNSLKSTSLIMNTIKTTSQSSSNESTKPDEHESTNTKLNETTPKLSENTSKHNDANTHDFIIPKQLDALKKLYEDAGELSDDQADEEVRSYMMDELDDDKEDDTSSTVLSGSWRKMKAMQMLQEYKTTKTVVQQRIKPEPINQSSLPKKQPASEPRVTKTATLQAPSLVARNRTFEQNLRSYPKSTYFGAIRSPRSPRKYSERVNALEKRNTLTNKPDLLCHTQNAPEPLYENIHKKYALRTKETIENETAILEELTRAADQILQVVHGYTDEESLQISTDDELRRKPMLSTISETNTTRKTEMTKVRTRRIQRASSREALLQSHGGSSSEDITTPNIVRKPRSTRRTKTQNSDSGARKSKIQNGDDMKLVKKNVESSLTKKETLRPGLHEIRHKTAVSTIRSLAEKQADQRQKNERKKVLRPSTTSQSSRPRVSQLANPLRKSTVETADQRTSGVVSSNPRRGRRNEAISRH